MAKTKIREQTFLVGIDEVGRGALAGPVVACAVMLSEKANLNHITIKDSKKLLLSQREESYKKLIKHPSIKWGMGIVSEKIIDKINIREATKEAMLRAALKLDCKKIHLVIDGNFTINTHYRQKAVKRADEFILECMIASIIAKVERDKIMQKYAKRYPEYGFERHKGYGTKFHYGALIKKGPCIIHRRSYRLF